MATKQTRARSGGLARDSGEAGRSSGDVVGAQPAQKPRRGRPPKSALLEEDGARERILAAADALFGEVGFDAASTREVGERAGVNKALIHYHFAGKDGLFAAVLERYYAALGAEMAAGFAEGRDDRTRLRAVLSRYVDFLAAHGGFARMVQREAAGGRHVQQVIAHTVPFFSAGRALLLKAHPRRAGGPLDPAQLLISFYGMAVGYFAYLPAIEPLLGVDPMSTGALAARKRHLLRMVDLVWEADARSTAREPSAQRARSVRQGGSR